MKPLSLILLIVFFSKIIYAQQLNYFNDDVLSSQLTQILESNHNSTLSLFSDFGCTEPTACNYNPLSIFDDGSCIIQGTPCDDGNFNTINDVYGEFCNCYGLLNTTNCGDDIMISEYVEGSANNKAIELFNPTNQDIDLSVGNYSFGRERNGNGIPMLMPLSGVIPARGVRVFALDKRDPFGIGTEVPISPLLEAVADTFVNPIYIESDSPFYFTGDDAFYLVKNGTVIDLIGKTGEDPGNGWYVPDDPYTRWWTANHTMIRKPSITNGVYTSPFIFDPSLEWDTLGIDDFSHLGWHETICQTQINPGCLDILSCNYNSDADADDGSCFYPGQSCNDNNNYTYNDFINESCQCEGIPYDSFNTCEGDSYNISTSEDTYYNLALGETANLILNLYLEFENLNLLSINTTQVNFAPLGSNNFQPINELGLTWSCSTQDCVWQPYSNTGSQLCLSLTGIPNQIGTFQIQVVSFFSIITQIIYFENIFLNITTTCTDPLACNFGAPNICSYLEPQTIIGNPNITPFNTYSYVVPQGEYGIEWAAQNGTIITGQGTNAVQIMWLENGPYSVSATVSNEFGCVATSSFIATNNSCNISVSATTSDDVLCPGEIAVLSSATATPNADYQWYLNGQAIPNATANSYDADVAGEYQVMISIPGCSTISNSITIAAVDIVNEPVIDFLVSNPGCGNGVAILSFNDEDFTSFLWSNNLSTPTISVTASGVYSVSAVDASGCVVTSAEVPINFALTEPNDICLVTVDETTGNNTIVWEPVTSEFITDYLIYKETNVANEYALIGSVPYGSDGVFADVNSNAAVQASRYKVGVMDICNVESTLSPLHKTIHLTSNLGVGDAINLIWSHYEGAEFGSYNIYRGTAADNLTLLTTIASNLNSYTDLLPIADGYYMIEVEGISCDPSREVLTSKSNIITIAEVGVSDLKTSQLALYPNPANDYIILNASEQLIGDMYVIYDITGREVLRGKINSTNTRIALENQSSGSYVLRVGERGLRFEK